LYSSFYEKKIDSKAGFIEEKKNKKCCNVYNKKRHKEHVK
jgi:hypothetical protein